MPDSTLAPGGGALDPESLPFVAPLLAIGLYSISCQRERAYRETIDASAWPAHVEPSAPREPGR